MTKTQTKGIVIAVGAIITFIIILLLRGVNPLLGYAFSFTIIAVLAVTFGSIVGGAVGVFSNLLIVLINIIMGYYRHGFFIFDLIDITFIIFSIFIPGLYGFIIGKISEIRNTEAYSKNGIVNIAIFSLIAMGLYIVLDVIHWVFYGLMTGFWFSGYSFSGEIIPSLIIGCVSFVLIFIYHKFSKQDMPFFQNENKTKENIQSSTAVNSTPLEKKKTKFTGGVLPIFLFPLWAFPFMAITFGLALPWIICMVMSWICTNTIIGGRRLRFKGTGGGLFGRYILWYLLTIITFGIYSYWAARNSIKWAIENIEMVD